MKHIKVLFDDEYIKIGYFELIIADYNTYYNSYTCKSNNGRIWFIDTKKLVAYTITNTYEIKKINIREVQLYE